MGIDLKKVSTEIKDLESMLAAIDHDIEECRLRHFEHPWASQIRRTLTFERHRLQRRLEELTFVCKCVGGRPLGFVAVLSFGSLAATRKGNTEGLEHLDEATFDVQSDRPTLRVIQGGRI